MTNPSPANLRVPERLLFRNLDGEAVLLELDSGKYYGLNEVGTRIWELLAEHRDTEAVCRSLLAEFDVSEERLRIEVQAFVQALVARSLLRSDAS